MLSYKKKVSIRSPKVKFKFAKKQCFVIMLKFTSTKKCDITNEIAFEATMLRNGLMSLSDELKFAEDYDKITYVDSMFDPNKTSIGSDFSENLEENVLGDDLLYSSYHKVKQPEVNKMQKKLLPLKIMELTHKDESCDYDFVNNTCVSCFKTSTPIRIEFNPDNDIFPDVKKKMVKLETTEENIKELKTSEEMLENALALSITQTGFCSPRVTRSLQKIKRTSKKGAISALTTVLTNIL